MNSFFCKRNHGGATLKIKIDTHWNRFIKKCRIDSGLSLEELSQVTGFSVDVIRLYEEEKRSISTDTLHKFTKAFGIEMNRDSSKKGSIVMTDEQKEKIKVICDSDKKVYEKYVALQNLFDITREELFAGKLFDDMDIYELLKYSPSKPAVTDRGEFFSKNSFYHEFELFVLCYGGKYGEKKEDEVFGRNLYIPGHIPEFIPHRRISQDGFITEQRRLLLPLLKECFEWDETDTLVFHYNTFRKKVGW